jgi:hypothetical protein
MPRILGENNVRNDAPCGIKNPAGDAVLLLIQKLWVYSAGFPAVFVNSSSNISTPRLDLV